MDTNARFRNAHTDADGAPKAKRLNHALNIEDLRQLAKRRLPRIVFDYIDGGAEFELTLRENSRAFDEGDVSAPQCSVDTRL